MLAVVWRVGEDKVVFYLMHWDETEYVGTYCEKLFHIEFCGCLTDKLDAVVVFIDGSDTRATSGNQFVGDVASSCEKV